MSELALAPGHAREYETIYILRPDIDAEQMSKLTGRVRDVLANTEGILAQAELWGRRRLAYPVRKNTRGLYVYLKYLGRGDTVSELERQLRLNDAVIRYQTIVLQRNVPLEQVTPDEDVSLAFDLPTEPMEPELSLVKQLGLDAPPPERRRRDDRRDDRRDRVERDSSANEEGNDSSATEEETD